jgi:alpha-glucuronidase
LVLKRLGRQCRAKPAWNPQKNFNGDLYVNKNKIFRIGMAAGLLLWIDWASAQTSAVLIYSDTQPAIKFAAAELKAALEQKNHYVVGTASPSQIAAQAAPVQIIVTTNGAITGQPAVGGLSKEGYAVRRITVGNITRWWVIGNDAPGAMYAGLELADSVKIDGSLNNVNDNQRNPNLAVRGIKFNIPLDDRTPSYSDDSTAAQSNTGEVWSMPYWTHFWIRWHVTG